jgi:hypothetical protein
VKKYVQGKITNCRDYKKGRLKKDSLSLKNLNEKSTVLQIALVRSRCPSIRMVYTLLDHFNAT